MYDFVYKRGSTGVKLNLDLTDIVSRQPKQGMAYTDVTIYYVAPGAAPVSIVPATLASNAAAWSAGGFVEVDANSPSTAPGVYRFDPPDAVMALAAPWVDICVTDGSNGRYGLFRVGLLSIDFQDAIRAGLTALPNANAEAAGGLYTRGANAGQINQSANGQIDAKAVTMSAASVQAIWDALTSALTTAGSIGKRITDFLTGDAFVRLGAPAGGSTGADIAAIKAELDAVKAELDLVKAKTDGLPGDPADASDIATAFAGVPHAVLDTSLSGHSSAGTVGGALAAATSIPVIADAVASASSASVFTGSGALSNVDSAYKSMLVVFTSGGNVGVARKVTGYVGSSRQFTVDVALPETPGTSDTFDILGYGG